MPEPRDLCASDLGRTFREHSDGLYRLARRLLGDDTEAEDAVREAFLRLTRRVERPDGLVSARAFVFRIVRTLCIERLRGRGPQTRPVSGTGPEGQPRACCASTTPESFRLVADAMNALPEVEAEALSLVVVEGLTYREVAAATEVPIGTLRARLNRARRTLRAALHDRSPGSLPDIEAPAIVDLPRRVQ